MNNGFKVYGTSRSPEKINNDLDAAIEFLSLDLTSDYSRKVCISTLLKREGQIDILINNAGYGQMGPLIDIPKETLQKQFETNLFGPAALTQLVIPAMINRRSGKIVNISSISGVLPSAFSGAYCASKAAMNAWSDALRMELKPFGIKVITVQPGAILSNFGDSASNSLTFTSVQEKSYYAPIAEFISNRAKISQINATPAEVFAKRLVKQLLRNRPKSVIRIGKSSFIFPFLKRWLPDFLLDKIISRKFGLTKLGSSEIAR